MAKQPADKPDANAPADGLPWSKSVRRVVSILIAFHVAALFIAPWSLPPPASQLSRNFAGAIGPYLNALNINNGYRFFAPNPPLASSLVRYDLQMADGSVESGIFPNLDDQWPRQLYHRHFMLSETLNREANIELPPPPQQRNPAAFNQMSQSERRRAIVAWQSEMRQINERRKLGQELVESVAQSLLVEHDAVAVRLWLVNHFVASPEDVIRGVELNDERYTSERPLGEFQRR